MIRHGTDYSSEQYDKVLVVVAGALPKVLAGTDPEQMIFALQKRGEALEKTLVEAFLSFRDGATSREVFTLTLEGAYKVSELVKQGKYDWVNDWITDECFPLEFESLPMRHTIELVEFEHDSTSEEVLAEFERLELERPTYEDALYFGIQYPEEQRKYPIVFLHEPVQGPCGRRHILGLDERVGKRRLNLRWFDNGWLQKDVFAAVRK